MNKTAEKNYLLPLIDSEGIVDAYELLAYVDE